MDHSDLAVELITEIKKKEKKRQFTVLKLFSFFVSNKKKYSEERFAKWIMVKGAEDGKNIFVQKIKKFFGSTKLEREIWFFVRP